MTNQALLVLLIGNFVAANFARRVPLDDVDQGKHWRVNYDPLDLLRRYAWGNEESRRNVEDDSANWNGRWMPDRPGDPTPPPKIFPQTAAGRGSAVMGRPSKNCDDAKTNLTIDWDRSSVDRTCYGRKIMPSRETAPVKYCETVPKNYVAAHKCMHETIEYDDDVPLYGAHRPLWPVYGEYEFLPKQRWLHSLEHGAIVALYHPCANPLETKRLKNLVAGCLRRHVVSPYDRLDEERPLALLAWGCRLTMSYANPTIARKFIREHALRGPEDISSDGDFDDGLLFRAKIVSDKSDSNLCPHDADDDDDDDEGY